MVNILLLDFQYTGPQGPRPGGSLYVAYICYICDHRRRCPQSEQCTGLICMDTVQKGLAPACANIRGSGRLERLAKFRICRYQCNPIQPTHSAKGLGSSHLYLDCRPAFSSPSSHYSFFIWFFFSPPLSTERGRHAGVQQRPGVGKDQQRPCSFNTRGSRGRWASGPAKEAIPVIAARDADETAPRC